MSGERRTDLVFTASALRRRQIGARAYRKHQMCQDALEDGILMDCDEAQLRATLHRLVDLLDNPYVGRKAD